MNKVLAYICRKPSLACHPRAEDVKNKLSYVSETLWTAPNTQRASSYMLRVRVWRSNSSQNSRDSQSLSRGTLIDKWGNTGVAKKWGWQGSCRELHSELEGVGPQPYSLLNHDWEFQLCPQAAPPAKHRKPALAPAPHGTTLIWE